MVDLLNTKSYYYELPKDLIAQHPLDDRSSSKLMVINRNVKSIEHRTFSDIIDFVSTDDVLVINTTKVMPARLFGVKETGGMIELLLLQPQNDTEWTCLVKPGKIKIGSKIRINDELTAEINGLTADGMRLVTFSSPESVYTILEKYGHIPLPPYITRKSNNFDTLSYQTVYAKQNGSVAAPTAGLHFTEELLSKIKKKGIKIAEVVLNVGLGTFKPVGVDNITEHKMHSELCEISKETADIINNAKKENKKIISVGTTTTRTLESFSKGTQIEYGKKWTNIFLYPGKPFHIVDAQITNFHLPQSTLLMLVSAFAGYDLTMKAYQIAIKKKYRFFSYGDAMLIY